MSNLTKQWYVLYTKTGAEKKVSNLLNRKNIDNYFPVKRNENTKKRVVLEPLFSSYVFVQVNEAMITSIRGIDGVINFAYWLGKPAVIRNEEIEIMKRFVDEYANIQVEKTALNVNGTVRVIGTPQMEQKGHVLSVKNNHVKIVLPSLGYILVAEIEKSGSDLTNGLKDSFTFPEKLQYAV